jgi:hypothetical protein
LIRSQPEYAKPYYWAPLSSWGDRRLFQGGRGAAWLLTTYAVVTMIQLAVLGGQPTTAAEAFRLLQEDRSLGILRLDLLTVLALPLYYLRFLGLFVALKEDDPAHTNVATALAFVGVTLLLATPMGLSMLPLSDKHASATSEEARTQLLAAGEAIMAADIWHGTAPSSAGSFCRAGASSSPSSCCARGSSASDRLRGHPDPRARSRPHRSRPLLVGGRRRGHRDRRTVLPDLVSPGRPAATSAGNARVGPGSARVSSRATGSPRGDDRFPNADCRR